MQSLTTYTRREQPTPVDHDVSCESKEHAAKTPAQVRVISRTLEVRPHC